MEINKVSKKYFMDEPEEKDKELDPSLFEDADDESLLDDEGEDILLPKRKKVIGDDLESETESLDAMAEEEDDEPDGGYDDLDLL